MRLFKKKSHGLIALALVAGITLVTTATALAGFGPNRPTFTWNSPASYVTFNSITDNPVVGDERAFYTVRDANASTNTYVDTINVSDNQELVLRVYFHNNAASNLNLVAQNTKVRMSLPTTTNSSLESIAYISADNANPQVVHDTANFTASKPFSLQYVPGSALIRTNALNDVKLSDSIVTDSGALIGYNAIDGKVPGCAEFSGWVIIKVRVKMQPQITPAYSCDALNVTVGNGRKVDANVAYTATGGASLKTVTFDFGDGSTPLVTSNKSASYTYTKDGNYTIKSTLTFNVGGTDKTAFCTKQVSISTPTPPQPPKAPEPPTKTPPTVTPPVLPNTGAGSVAAIFAGVSAIAGAGHYFVTRRANQ